jgi:hypothetical protein
MFHGSPRILPFMASALLANKDGINALNPLNGSVIKYYLIPRPDIKKKTCLWMDNTFIGSGDQIPGIKKISVRTIEAKQPPKVSVTNVSSY